MPMIRLVYASEATDGLVYRDFLTIMEHAAESNRTQAISGMLCHGGGKFLQVLEGERVAVNALYHHIAGDHRHTACQLLRVEEIDAREFAEWSMKIIDWSDAEAAARRAALLSHAGTTLFDPMQMSGNQALSFLQELAAAERLLLE